MMTGIDLVTAAIEFTYPERLPFVMGVSSPSDVFSVSGKKPNRQASGTRYTDEFSCVFAVLNNKTIGQPTDFPIKSIKELDRYT